MWRFIVIIFCFLSFFVKHQFADEPDSIVFLKDLSFQSTYEKDAFLSIDSDQGTDYPNLFIAIDSCSPGDFTDINHAIADQTYTYSKNVKFEKLNDKKKVKNIYNDIHNTYLKKYEINSYFSHLFKTGEYNCVTASAFYGILFNELKIPFTIKESYDHVYIIGYPETLSIRVESTDPKKGYFVYDDRTKAQFVDFMKQSKMISQEEFDQKTTEALFNEYYFKEEDINLLQLAGIQYQNKALELLVDKQFEAAFTMTEKAYYLHPQERTGFLLLITAANVLNGCNYEDIHYADYIYKIARYKKYGVTNDDIKDEFIKITQKLLVAQYNMELYDAYFSRIENNIDDTALIKEISFIYNYERGRILFNDNKYDLSLSFIEAAYKLKPKHVDARQLFVSNVLANFSTINDPANALAQLNEYVQNYPDLMNNNSFSELRCTLLLALSVESFATGNSRQAFEYIQTFEEVEESSSINFNSYMINDAIIEAYSRAASYYFRRGNYKNVKHYLNQGLKYVPNSYELKNKLRSINY